MFEILYKFFLIRLKYFVYILRVTKLILLRYRELTCEDCGENLQVLWECGFRFKFSLTNIDVVVLSNYRSVIEIG